MIDAGLLHDLTEYINGRVDKVVINGTYEITSLQVKQVTDNVLALNYIVPAAEVSLITLVELKDAVNVTLTSNTVNVPITADHLMLQTITVREGT
ncbi:ketopantoate hydroxymethyltransferase [Cohnella boryungensis]|uniref:Ketopantoate hydroxymethyltransferase n=1 Tax=Cohnella boryungensis TaxID=768479 RepID=A0ABV8SF01_9BACL